MNQPPVWKGYYIGGIACLKWPRYVTASTRSEARAQFKKIHRVFYGAGMKLEKMQPVAAA